MGDEESGVKGVSRLLLILGTSGLKSTYKNKINNRVLLGAADIYNNVDMSQEYAAPASVLPVGTTLQMGKYRIVRFIASGGFGNTYEVLNVEFEERMAMKEFFMRGVNEREDDSVSVSVSNADNKKQFEVQKGKLKKEARRLRRLHNENIVKVHDLFEENGTVYYVMDYIDGESLSKRIKRTDTPLSEDEVRAILPQLLKALEEVHRNGIWHLDIKPANIMVDTNGKALLIDFGASKQLRSSEGYSVSTSTAMCYTPGYAPMEQIEQDFDKFGPWTDFYALGATLYCLLTTNKPPSTSEIAEGNAFVFPPSVSPRMRQLVEWLMQPARRKRPQSVNEIRDFIKEEPVTEEEEETTVYVDSPKEETVVQAEKKNAHIKEEKAQPRKEKVQAKRQVKDTAINKGWWKSNLVFVTIACAVVGVSLFIYKGCYSTDAPMGHIGSEQADTVYVDTVAVDTTYMSYVEGENIKLSIGTCSYTGDIDENGKPDGEGTAKFSDGRLYKGCFVHGIMDGEAWYRYSNGDVFEGSFKNDEYHEGKYTIKSDGSYFVGTFKNGQPANGQWYDKNGNKI